MELGIEESSCLAVVNPTMPYTFGEGVIHISHIDSLVETARPVYIKGKDEPFSEVEDRIGKIIAENLVENGATLQMGREEEEGQYNWAQVLGRFPTRH